MDNLPPDRSGECVHFLRRRHDLVAWHRMILWGYSSWLCWLPEGFYGAQRSARSPAPAPESEPRNVSSWPKIGIGGSLAAPPLPHHRTYGSVYGGSRSYANALRSSVSAGRSDPLTAESDSMSSRPACRASPFGVDEKSSLDWMFSRLSLSRFMSYLPLLSFGPSAIVPGAAYPLAPPFGDGVPH
jgi:hypothetical protein